MKLPKELTTVTPLSKLLAMILFVSLPVVGFLLGMRHQQVTSSPIITVSYPTPVADETANWKTYKNEEFGFEIKYPNNYSIKTRGERREGGLIYALSAVDIHRETATSLITINVMGPNFVLGTRDWEDFSLGEIQGRVAYNWQDWKVREKVSSAEIIFTSKNDQSFFITTAGDPFEDKTINQILTTFRFD